MRPIVKEPEPPSFVSWKSGFGSTPLPSWRDFGYHHPSVKTDLKCALLAEQGHVCCYCEREIKSSDSHIEHLTPKGRVPAKTYDYQNLLASCEGEKSNGRPPETCGHLKQENLLPVHPLMGSCTDRFVFGSDGSVAPTLDPDYGADAAEAIRVVGLDAPRLRVLRKTALADIDGQLPDPGDAPEEFLRTVRDLIQETSRRDSQGRHHPFATAIVQYLSRYLPAEV